MKVTINYAGGPLDGRIDERNFISGISSRIEPSLTGEKTILAHDQATKGPAGIIHRWTPARGRYSFSHSEGVITATHIPSDIDQNFMNAEAKRAILDKERADLDARQNPKEPDADQ